MDFDLTEDQREIQRTARDVLQAHANPTRVRAVVETGTADAALQATLVELGWAGIAIAPEHGGLGLGAVEAVILFEQLGYALAGAPLLGTIAAAFVLAEAGSEAQRSEWLPRIAEGECSAALAVAHDGVASLVPDAGSADLIVRIEGDRAWLLTAGEADVTPVTTIDLTRSYARVASTGQLLPGDPGAASERAAVMLSAELVGLCQRALDATVEHVRDRHQFGRPIGSFQAIAHRCADMLLATESARSATYFAAWSADADPDGLTFAASLAKAVASGSAVEATASAIQAHGGVGFTWEADVHLLYRRAQVGAQLLGDGHRHRATLARLLLGRG